LAHSHVARRQVRNIFRSEPCRLTESQAAGPCDREQRAEAMFRRNGEKGHRLVDIERLNRSLLRFRYLYQCRSIDRDELQALR
jgi:hypothetical protein